ncbi:helix-turn-helix transcriptional regulator [Nonomuraea longicatena]|uniref:Helix-turn-helix transcriptional regulator n=1 Tax=Nonomuraea longicatena TaxID=83682 RepID=A0ABN1QGZ8_9ACTN
MSTRRLSPAKKAAIDLGERLRQLRTSAGFSQRALGQATGWHFTKISRMENGGKSPTEAEIRLWCRLCHAEGEIPDLVAGMRALESMYREHKRQTRAGMRRLVRSSVPLYERTTSFRIYEHNAIPGLFQTADYAEAMLSFWIGFLDTPNDLDDAVRAQQRRQGVVRQQDKRFEVVIEEQALRTLFGTAETQATQLERLLEILELPNVLFGVIPMMVERPCVASVGFWIFDHESVQMETPSAAIEVTRPGEVDLYVRMFDLLASVAVYGESARTLIEATARELRAMN